MSGDNPKLAGMTLHRCLDRIEIHNGAGQHIGEVRHHEDGVDFYPLTESEAMDLARLWVHAGELREALTAMLEMDGAVTRCSPTCQWLRQHEAARAALAATEPKGEEHAR